jgi:hypothetical protein
MVSYRQQAREATREASDPSKEELVADKMRVGATVMTEFSPTAETRFVYSCTFA